MRIVWSVPWRTRFDVNAADPVICSEGAVVSSGYEVGSALFDPRSGREVWCNKVIRAQCSPLVRHDGVSRGRVQRLSRRTAADIPRRGVGPPWEMTLLQTSAEVTARGHWPYHDRNHDCGDILAYAFTCVVRGNGSDRADLV